MFTLMLAFLVSVTEASNRVSPLPGIQSRNRTRRDAQSAPAQRETKTVDGFSIAGGIIVLLVFCALVYLLLRYLLWGTLKYFFCTRRKRNGFKKRITTLVGPNGGTVVVGESRVVFPEAVVDEPVEIHLTFYFRGESMKNRLTPELKCEPQGLKFLKDVEVTLPVRFEKSESSVAAAARRSEDKIYWENIEIFDHRAEQSFTFAIQSSGWYDVVFLPSTRYSDLVCEKSVICGIKYDYSDDPQSLIVVCYICNLVEGDSHIDCKLIWRTTLRLRTDEREVTFQLTSSDVNIQPDSHQIKNARASPREEALFTLRKRSTNLIHQQIMLRIQTSRQVHERSFPIPPASRKSISGNNDPGGISAAGSSMDANLTQVQDACVGNGNILNTFHYHGTATPAVDQPMLMKLSRESFQQ